LKVSNLGTSSSTTRKFPTNVLEFFSEQGNTGTITFYLWGNYTCSKQIKILYEFINPTKITWSVQFFLNLRIKS
jgi:hypothetical protein